MEKPITHGPVNDIAFKVCQCCRCRVVARCTMSFDFYTRAKDPEDGPLYCYSCLLEDAGLPDGGSLVFDEDGTVQHIPPGDLLPN